MPGSARAQLGVSASLLSDDQYRGHSLSDRRPVAVLSLSYDHGSGAYAGVSLSAPDSRLGAGGVGVVDYLGYARRLGAGPAFDAGVTDNNVISYKFPRRRVNYQEVYAGLIGDHVSVHAHYSPNYFHSGAPTLYADLDAAVRPAPDWRVFGRVGALTPLGGPVAHGARKERYDLSAGVARTFAHSELSLSWTSVGPVPDLPDGRPQDRDAVVLGASYFF